MKTLKKLNIVFLLVILLSASQLFNKTFGQNSNDSTYNYFTITEIQDAYYDSLIAIRGCDSMRGTGYKNYFR